MEKKTILLGISGCIAAYKACFLIRLLKKAGADVKVVLTDSGSRFVTKTTLETLSENPVATEMFPEDRYVATHHISYAEWADLIVLAPATGNLIGKIANGIADDLLTTIVMAKQSDVLIAPAMNTEMYNNPIVQKNIGRLRSLGYRFVEPGTGELACETVGVGRLAEPEEIFEKIREYFIRSKSLQGKRVVVTAGPTIEKIDPVRFISNFSSGRMGYALATEAAARGAEVVLISGPTSLETPRGVKLSSIESAKDLHQEVKRVFPKSDILIMAAAVADFKPATFSKIKMERASATTLKLTSNPDILAEIGKSKKPSQIVVGFALEVGSDKKRALSKLKEKRLDMIVMNDPTAPGSEFGGDYNQATILDAKGKELALQGMPKRELAKIILDEIEKRLKKKK